MSTSTVVPPLDAVTPASAVDIDARGILQFEARWPQHSAAKEQQIAALWGMSAVRYYQVLARVSAQPSAIAAEPFVAARVRRQRGGRAPLLGESAEHSRLGSVASSGAFELHA